MRKKFIIVLLSLIIAVPLIAGGHPSEGAGNEKSYEAIKWDDIIPVYSQAAGTAYILNGAFVDLASRYMPGVTFVTEGTSGSFEIMNLLEERARNGRAAISFSASDGVYMARHGEGLFQTPLTEVYQASFLHANEIWLTVPRNSPIQTYEDVRGKRVGVGPVGSSISILTSAMLNAYGVTFDDFNTFYVNYEGVTSGMQDGSLDGGFFGGPPPFSVYEDLANNMNVKVIGVSSEKAESILNENPYFLKRLLPAGIMKGVDEDTVIMAIVTMVNMNSAVSEELAYAILEMIYDHAEEFRSYAPAYMKDFYIENWNLALCAEMHTGAVKFYKDKGVYND